MADDVEFVADVVISLGVTASDPKAAAEKAAEIVGALNNGPYYAVVRDMYDGNGEQVPESEWEA